MNKLMVLMLLTVSFSSNAFRSNKYESFTDPDYDNFRPKHVVVLVDDSSSEIRQEIQSRATKYFSKKGVKAQSYQSIFPPTRQWSGTEIMARLKAQNIDSVLVITAGAASREVIPVMTNTFSNTTTNGNINNYGGNQYGYTANSHTNSTSYNVNYAKSKAEFSAVLFDASTGNTAWYADIVTKAGGTLFVGEKGDAKGVIKTVVKALEADNLISK